MPDQPSGTTEFANHAGDSYTKLKGKKVFQHEEATMRSITVADCMTRRVVALAPDMEVVEAIRILLKHKVTAAPVLDSEHKLVGILSESDCLSATLTSSYYSQDFGLVSEYMTASVMSAGEEDSVLDVYERFMKQRGGKSACSG